MRFPCPSTLLFGWAERLTTWSFPQTWKICRRILKWCGQKGIPTFILGNGTNLLVRDGGIRGMAISLSRGFLRVDGGGARAGRKPDLRRSRQIPGKARGVFLEERAGRVGICRGNSRERGGRALHECRGLRGGDERWPPIPSADGGERECFGKGKEEWKFLLPLSGAEKRMGDSRRKIQIEERNNRRSGPKWRKSPAKDGQTTFEPSERRVGFQEPLPGAGGEIDRGSGVEGKSHRGCPDFREACQFHRQPGPGPSPGHFDPLRMGPGEGFPGKGVRLEMEIQVDRRRRVKKIPRCGFLVTREERSNGGDGVRVTSNQ